MTLLIRRKKDKGLSKFGNIEVTKEASMPMIGPDRDKKLLEAATALISKGSLSMTCSEEEKRTMTQASAGILVAPAFPDLNRKVRIRIEKELIL
jgi:hypothetical protein